MASATWQIRGIDTLGRDLVLSRLVPWGAAGAVTPLTITSTMAPTSGDVVSLLVDDTAQCVFAAADVQKPGFAIEFTFAQAVDLWGFRFAGPSAVTWPAAHAVMAAGLVAPLPAVPFLGAGVLSQAPTQALRLGIALNEWSALTAAGSREWVRCAMSADGQVLLATAYSGGYLWLSKDGGTTWVAQTAAGSRNWYGCAASANGQVLLASAYGGNLWLSKDGGATWVAQTAAGSRNWVGCSVSADGQVLLAPAYNNGNLWLSRDGGATWVAQSAAGARSWYGCAVSANGQVLLASAAGADLWLSKDGGATWGAQTAAGSRNWYECAMSADGQVLLATVFTSGNVWLSKDGGATWAAQAAAGIQNWQGCAVSGNGQVLVVNSSGGGIWVSKDGGSTWAVQSAPVGLNWYECAASADGLTLFAVPYGGSMHLLVSTGPQYQERPQRMQTSEARLVIQGQAPDPQGMGVSTEVKALPFNDLEFGGNGQIYGTVERQNTPANLPLRRRVRLHRSRDGLLVRETWSQADGRYAFTHISTAYEYDTIAWDHDMSYRSVMANNLKPEVMP